MKKITIIGANSYIARNLTYMLETQKEGCRIKLYGREREHADGLTDYTCVDALDREDVKNIDFDCDIVYFFVGKTGSADAFKDFGTFIDANEKTLLNVMSEYVEQKSSAKLVFPSTRLVYQGACGSLAEDDAKAYKSVYAVNKHACEMYVRLYHEMFDLQYLILRICVPYGTMAPGAISYGTMEFMLKNAGQGKDITIYGDGTVRRTMTYIGDLCRAMIMAGAHPECKNDVYNVGGEEYMLGELAQIVAQKHGVGVRYIPWPELAKKMESGDTVFDSAKLDRLISYRSVSLKQWIKGEI